MLAIALFSLPASADSYRLLIVLPTAVIMMAVALNYILEIQGVGWTQARNTYIVIVTVALSSLLVFNLWSYYVDFAGQCKFGSDDGPTRFASYLGNYARGVDLVRRIVKVESKNCGPTPNQAAIMTLTAIRCASRPHRLGCRFRCNT